VSLAILGGSFNPIHLGHLFLAKKVLAELHYDRVVLVPAYRSPFKLDTPHMESSANDRLEMVAAAIAGDPRLTVDNCEIRREGVSYTVDTIADIIRRYIPEGKPGLIIGDDLAEEFTRWRKSGEILEMADIIIVRRKNSGEQHLPYPHIRIAGDVMDISSGQVREKITAQAADSQASAWHDLVPDSTRIIIETRGLYGITASSSEENPSQNLILRVEEMARKSMGIERFLHSRNVALMAWDLCRRLGPAYQLDPELGYLAGIAHDLGKPFSEKELLRLVKHDGGKISQLEKDKPSLLHGRVSAVLLKERFNVHTESVLEAVALHTSGGKKMGPLAKVIYIADKMEFSREKISPAIRNLVYTENDLDTIFFAVLEHNVSWLRTKKLVLSKGTLSLLKERGILNGTGKK
jgi:nicotinate-nucleotide adenylyltransferase